MSKRETLPVDADNHLLVAINVREKLSDKTRWTTGKLARDIHGNEVNIASPEAYAYCLIGARAAVIGTAKNYHDCYDDLGLVGFADFLGLPTEWATVAHRIFSFNDTSSHAQVLKCLDNAILRATTKGA